MSRLHEKLKQEVEELEKLADNYDDPNSLWEKANRIAYQNSANRLRKILEETPE